MSFAIPNFSRKQVTRAGNILIDETASYEKRQEALLLINHWRACHAYPVNTFQATLRARLKRIGMDELVATRLKRIPSITKKLKDNPGMQLARMQDVGGLRAIVATTDALNKLVNLYNDGSLTHQLVGIDDYVAEPKSSGYRSIHLIYRYSNPIATEYDSLSLELQVRTKLQHAWATAVETVGTFLNEALKSSEGPDEWLSFFKTAGAAFALVEQCPVHRDFEKMKPIDVLKRCILQEKKLDVRRKLQQFALATQAISTQTANGSYHLVVLDALERKVTVESFGQKRLEEANSAYAKAESRAADSNEAIQPVLVTTSSIKALRRAYPNYFLDTRAFTTFMTRLERTIDSR